MVHAGLLGHKCWKCCCCRAVKWNEMKLWRWPRRWTYENGRCSNCKWISSKSAAIHGSLLNAPVLSFTHLCIIHASSIISVFSVLNEEASQHSTRKSPSLSLSICRPSKINLFPLEHFKHLLTLFFPHTAFIWPVAHNLGCTERQTDLKALHINCPLLNHMFKCSQCTLTLI